MTALKMRMKMKQLMLVSLKITQAMLLIMLRNHEHPLLVGFVYKIVLLASYLASNILLATII